MSDPAAAIHAAQQVALRAAPAVTALFPGGKTRLYTMSAPVDAPHPHLVLGELQIVGDSAACVAGSEATATIHIYAREATIEASRLKAIALAGAVRATLDVDLPLIGHTIIDWSFETTRHLSDPDLLTAHSVVSQNYYTEPTA